MALPSKRSTILIIIKGEPGHTYPTLALAKELSARGWNVVYAGMGDAGAIPREHGFEYRALADPAWLQAFRRELSRFNIRAANRRFEQLLASLQQHFSSEDISLILVDPAAQVCALAARPLGIPVVLSYAAFAHLGQGFWTPPFSSAIGPGRNAKNALLILLDRIHEFWRLRAVLSLGSKLFGPQKILRRKARALGIPLRFGGNEPRLILPELVFLPKALQFSPGKEVYAGLSVYEKKEPAFAFERLAPGRPLIICSLGSQSHRYEQGHRLYKLIIESVAGIQDVQCVIHLPRVFSELEKIPHGGNLIFEEKIPQRALLKHAALMLTHGAGGTIKECIEAGVPSIAFPCAADQPGVSARAAHAGIALIVKRSEHDVKTVRAIIRRVMGNPIYRTNVMRLRAQIGQENELPKAIAFVESLASAPRGDRPRPS